MKSGRGGREKGKEKGKGRGTRWRREKEDEQVKKARAEQKEKREKESVMRKVFTYLWEEGVSPFQLVRNLTVFGPMLVGKVRTLSLWLRRRPGY